jgi:hypothetical protein
MSRNAPNRIFDHVYAIVRIDSSAQPLDASGNISFDCVTVLKVVWEEEDAVVEVERLNALNGDKGCRYFMQVTRLKRKVDG